MKEILRFVLLFILTYAAVMLLLNIPFIQNGIQQSVRSVVKVFVKASFPNAYIDTQDYKDASGKADPNVFYLTYGNPEIIQAEHDYAKRNQLMEYKISTYSIQLYIFQLFTVPLVFILSLFLASPMLWKPKLKFLLTSLSIMFMLILLKTDMLILYNINMSQIGLYKLEDQDMANLLRFISMLTLGFSVMLGFILWLVFGFRNSQFVQLVDSFFKNIKQ
ncbi:MAG: hypothetical protein IPM34_11315 [Saprospiraceae bacterium]|nr:hypothetical protein [Saprospiraceae bacterium]